MVTAVTGMSLLTSARPVFYDLALIIWAKGVTVSFELTTPTRQKSDSWLASSAPVPKPARSVLMLHFIFHCGRAARVWIDTSAWPTASTENMLEQGKVTLWKVFFVLTLSTWKRGGLLVLCYLRRGTHKWLYLEAWLLSYKISPFQHSHRSKSWHQTCSTQVCSNQSQLVMDTKHPRHRTLGGPSVGFYSSACTNHSPGRQPHYLSCPF